jgi:hypothetical protein
MFKYLFLALLSITLVNCNTLEGHRGVSETIEESKSYGFFVYEYKPIEKEIIINDTLKLIIDRIWLEKQWGYGKNSERISYSDVYQMILETENKINGTFSEKWQIGSRENSFRPCSDTSIIIDFDKLPTDKEFQWDIYFGGLFEDKWTKTTKTIDFVQL